jgi:hypothetical protein
MRRELRSSAVALDAMLPRKPTAAGGLNDVDDAAAAKLRDGLVRCRAMRATRENIKLVRKALEE